jgi:hypothetical protein
MDTIAFLYSYVHTLYSYVHILSNCTFPLHLPLLSLSLSLSLSLCHESASALSLTHSVSVALSRALSPLAFSRFYPYKLSFAAGRKRGSTRTREQEDAEGLCG